MQEQIKIEQDRMVAIRYRLTDAETGAELDDNTTGDALSYLHGHGHILPGLETALADKASGEQLTITVDADQGYGPHRSEMVMEVPRDRFGFEVEVGSVIQAEAPDGRSHYLMVVGVSDEKVTVDGNHPLAGRSLHFEVSVESVREATEEELAES